MIEKIIEEGRKWAWVIIAVAALVLIGLVYDSCRGNPALDRLQGQYEAEKALRLTENDIHIEQIDRLNAVIAEQNIEIESLIETRVEREGERRKLLAQVERLQAQEPVQPELESEALVINLRAQVNTLTLAVDTQEQIIQNNDKIIFSLTQKYQAQLKISDHYKGMYENEKALRIIAEEGYRLATSRVRSLRFTGNVKSGIVVAAGVAIAYILLK